jgi:hypothetical protein
MSENGQDKDVIWHDRPSIRKYLQRGNSRQKLAVLVKEEPWKEMDLLSLRDSYQTIKDNLIFFLEKSVAEKHIKSISITLQEPDSGDELTITMTMTMTRTRTKTTRTKMTRAKMTRAKMTRTKKTRAKMPWR